jgi:hypothetical protein
MLISIGRSLATIAWREGIQEMVPKMHAILIRQVGFRIEMTQRNYAHRA